MKRLQVFVPGDGQERPEELVPTPLRRSRAVAIAAFLLLLTSLWLPWWHAEYQESTGFGYDFFARPFGLGNADDGVNLSAIWVTSALASTVAGWLFVRLAGRSHAYEPRAWRRDLCLQAALVAAALGTTWFWPADLPFWGGRSYSGLADGATAIASFQPAAGWWMALFASILLGVAWWISRPPKQIQAQDATEAPAPRAK